ncbi:hypothetical protein CJU89_0193 [Yarrowia sp. B02]|nr:hypothetical protein CJU89_0193 [Yarrowia sp. B02]
MLRSCGRAAKPLTRLAAVHRRGFRDHRDPFRATSRFNIYPEGVDAPTGHRLTDTLSVALNKPEKKENGSGALKLAREIWETNGGEAFTPLLYGQLLQNVYREISELPISKLRSYNPARLQVLETLSHVVPDLDARHYTYLIKLAHLTRRPKQVQDAWEQAMLSDCDKSSALYNAYLRARTDSTPRLRGNSDMPDQTGAHFWATNKDVSTARANSVDPLEFMNEMRDAGIEPTRMTYSLALNHYAQQNNLPMAISICENLWGVGFKSGKLEGQRLPPTSIMHPTAFSLVAIIDAFGANDRLVEGKAYCETIADIYSIDLSSSMAQPYWTHLMRHALYTAIPYGQSAQDMCNAVWSKIVDFDYNPSPAQYSLRIRDLLCKERLGELQTLMHYAVSADKAELTAIVSTYLGLLLRRYSSTGNFPKAIEVAQTFQGYPQMQEYVRTKIDELEAQQRMSGNVAVGEEVAGEVDVLDSDLIQELKYIPEDEEDEENFLQL